MKKYIIAIVLAIILSLSVLPTFANETGYVNCDVLNVRVSPNTSSNIVTKLPYGTKLDIIYTDNGWYNIRMQDGVTGFVSAPYLSFAPAGSEAATLAANDAYNYLGCRYSYGSTGPYSFDCSGFTGFLYEKQGVSLPRTSIDQGSAGVYVEKTELSVGDLVFFSNRSDKRINHVGIYVGNNEFIHASTSGRGVVKDNLYEDYYVRNYVTARRVV